MNKWEYYTWNVAGTAGLYERQLREGLCELGSKGWELCSSHNGILLFKRPVAKYHKIIRSRDR